MSNTRSMDYAYENYVILRGNDYRHIYLLKGLQNSNLVKQNERDNSPNLLAGLLTLRSLQR